MPHSAKAESIQELDEGCGIPAHPDDVVLVVKERMHALNVSQVVRVFPAALRHRLFRRPEPEGLHPRRKGGRTLRRRWPRGLRSFATKVSLAHLLRTT